ncbi:MAG: hypothetical protein GY926_02295 [bacterium]|nr:hypothetical protein [bacterium]MCP4964044.1 hypothetical protein [bacterium]
METLVTIHSWTRWLVLAVLLGGAAFAVVRYRNKSNWEPSFFQLAVMVIDIQVAIGIVIWIFDDGWSETIFFKIIHPAFMLLALAVAHVGFVIAKKREDVKSWLVVAGSFVVSLILIVGAIPWDRLRSAL